MARVFKTIKVKITTPSIDIKIKIDKSAIFSCHIPFYMSEALGLGMNNELTNKSLEDLEKYLWECIHKYIKLETKITYRIKYSIMLSQRIKNKVPKLLMTPELWKKTAKDDYFNENDIVMHMKWVPLVRKELGEGVFEHELKLADEGDIERAEDRDYWADKLHKPWDGLLFAESGTHHAWSERGRMFDIPLTEETFNFFTSIEDNLANMISRLLSFLATDEKTLLSFIQNNALGIGGNDSKLIG